MEKISNFKQLKIWQKGIEIVKDIYRITNQFPREETYGLTSQMRRSAISIPSNIVEGFKRTHNKEFKQFLHISLGSLAELETLLVIVKELNYISNDELIAQTQNKLNHTSRMISSLLNKIH